MSTSTEDAAATEADGRRWRPPPTPTCSRRPPRLRPSQAEAPGGRLLPGFIVFLVFLGLWYVYHYYLPSYKRLHHPAAPRRPAPRLHREGQPAEPGVADPGRAHHWPRRAAGPHHRHHPRDVHRRAHVAGEVDRERQLPVRGRHPGDPDPGDRAGAPDALRPGPHGPHRRVRDDLDLPDHHQHAVRPEIGRPLAARPLHAARRRPLDAPVEAPVPAGLPAIFEGFRIAAGLVGDRRHRRRVLLPRHGPPAASASSSTSTPASSGGSRSSPPSSWLPP